MNNTFLLRMVTTCGTFLSLCLLQGCGHSGEKFSVVLRNKPMESAVNLHQHKASTSKGDVPQVVEQTRQTDAQEKVNRASSDDYYIDKTDRVTPKDMSWHRPGPRPNGLPDDDSDDEHPY